MASVDCVIYAHYVASGVSATGLTVTVDVHRVARADLTQSEVVTAGSATEVGDGVYAYRLAGCDPRTYDYVATFKTIGTADQQHVPACRTEFSPAAEVALPDEPPSNEGGLATADENGYARAAVNAYGRIALPYDLLPTQTGVSSTTVKLATSASSADNAYVGHAVLTGAQLRRVTAYVGSTRMATVEAAWDSQPAAGDHYVVLPAGLRNLDAAVSADPSGVTTLLARLTSARGGYLDNLNVGGPVASQADVNALNQSAARRVLLATSPQYERPESSSNTYGIELRTYDGDGAATNADSTPTLTATGVVSGSLAANLSAASNPATGVYRWTYTVASNATLEQVRLDASATIASSTFTIAAYTLVCDFVAATWTTSDRSLLTGVKAQTDLLDFNGSLLKVDVFNLQDEVITDASIADNAIVAAKVNAGALSGKGDWATASVQTSQGTTLSSIVATQAAHTTSLSNLSGVIVTKLNTAIELDGSVYRFTANALEQAPAGGGGGDTNTINVDLTEVRAQ